MKVAISENAKKMINFKILRETIDTRKENYTEICSAILTKDGKEEIKKINDTKFKIPLILIAQKGEIFLMKVLNYLIK